MADQGDGYPTLPFNGPIPRKVRSYGLVIDPTLLEPGDLLLFFDKQESWASKKIITSQSEQFDNEHARWFHVAVCGGRFEICEATRWGVTAREYWGYMTGRYEIRLRRLVKATAEEKRMVAYYAVTNVGTHYGFLNLLGVKQSLSDAGPWSRKFWVSSGVICSQLYFEACMRVGILLYNIPRESVTPAHLSVSSQLEDVPLRWMKIQAT